ncbi:MAG: hypothetical protein HQL46_13030 [Gammaproteobacteria bacterium]|nr:hypothetical protein [Gammaproteobacteria bacterium]
MNVRYWKMNRLSMINALIVFLLLVVLSACNSSSSSSSTNNNDGDTGTTEENDTIPVVNQSSGNPSFISTHFSGSGNCSNCHDGLINPDSKDVSIVKRWQSSIMANSSRDPFWKAKFKSELNRTPSLSSVINDKCTRCHAPMANVEAKESNTSITSFNGGVFEEQHTLHSQAMDGVSCTLCHQISNSDKLGSIDGFSGGYEINTNLSGTDRLLYGQYQDIFPNPMRNQVNFTPEYSTHISESSFCATCHNLKTPYTDASGNVLSTTHESEFPEQMPFSEWLHSDYASTDEKSCQQCHMSRSSDVVMVSQPPFIDTKRDNFAEHNFIGANVFMLNILNDNKEILGVLGTDFETTISETQSLLESSASLAVTNQHLDNNGLSFTLSIKSETGHKLPTSYPSRRVIVHVKITDALNNVVFESGKPNVDGSITGLDSDINQQTYEPHYDVINSSEQVQAYEGIMQDSYNQVTFTLLRAKMYLKDNRILPDGFVKDTAPDDIKVIGSASNDDNFIGGSDEVTYKLSALTDTSYSVQVRLLYQPLSYSFAQDLFEDTSDEVQQFKSMYESSTHKTQIISEMNFQVN